MMRTSSVLLLVLLVTPLLEGTAFRHHRQGMPMSTPEHKASTGEKAAMVRPNSGRATGMRPAAQPTDDLYGPPKNEDMWTTEDTVLYAHKMFYVSVITTILGACLVIAASLPLCCGILKGQGKIIAAVVMLLGVVAISVPYLVATNTCDPVVEEICQNKANDHKPCTSHDKEALLKGCHALGVLVAYGGVGWLTVILAIVACGLSGCIFCGCCAMKPDTDKLHEGEQVPQQQAQWQQQPYGGAQPGQEQGQYGGAQAWASPQPASGPGQQPGQWQQ